MDADGDLDLVFAVESGPDRVFLNDGSGQFADSGQALGSSGPGTRDVVLVDLDGDAVTYSAGQAHALDVLANDSDVDGDTLTVATVDAVSQLGAALGINADGTLDYDPTAAAALRALKNGELAVDRFTYTVSDGQGGNDTAEVMIYVEGVNDAPEGTATATLANGTEDTAYVVAAVDLLAGFSDVDGDALSVTGLTADHGSVADNGDGSLTLTPQLNYFGPVTLNYSVIDGNGGNVAATQSFALASVNDAPTLAQRIADKLATEGGAFIFAVSAGHVR